MKTKIIITSILLVSLAFFSFKITESQFKEDVLTYKTKFVEGFEDGHCEGWKDVKGDFAICPVPPIAPIPEIGQSYDSYKDGYNTGFKRGMRDARK